MSGSTTVTQTGQRTKRSNGRRVWLAIGIMSVAFNLLMAARSTGDATYFNLGLAAVWAGLTAWWDAYQARRQARSSISS